MSFFKKLFKGIAIGAAVGFTGGLGLGVLGLTTGASIGSTLALVGGKLVLGGAIYGGLQGAAMGLVKKPKMQTGSIADRQNISIDPQANGKWIFGETAAATDIVYSQNVDEQKIVHIIAAACHEIDSYGDFYINDEKISFSAGSSSGDWLGVLSVYRNLGTSNQNAISISGSSWPSTARGRGIAHYGIAWNFTSEKGKEKLASGIPTRITQVVKGCKVYDPRLDSTNGGTGTHRAGDQSTWEWSDNWALIVAHYLLGYYQNGKLVYGVGCSISEIDWPQVIAMANVCDEIVDEKPRYRISGIIETSQNHEAIITELESAVGGMVSKSGGRYYIWCPHNDLNSVGTLTDADIVSAQGISFSPSGPIENLYNTAQGRYVNPDLLYQLSPYPEVVESAAVTEDGRVRKLEFDLTFIQDVSIAQRVAREMVRRSRFTGTLNIAIGPRGLLLKPFDVVTVNFRETNYEDQLFRVTSLKYSAQGVVLVELLEEDSSIYDTSLPLGSDLTQLDPSSFDPAHAIPVENLQAENIGVNETGGVAVNAIQVTWDDPGAFVERTEIGYRINLEEAWAYQEAAELTSGLIVPALPNSFYEIRVRHWSLTGVAGPWSTVTITTNNAEYDRVSFLGIDDPIDPKIFVTLNPELATAKIKVSASFELDEFSAIPDRFFIFYSAAEAPNRLRVTTDSGNKLYLSEAQGDGVTALFELEVATGSTTKEVNFVVNSAVDIDTSGSWWASMRNEPGTPTRYNKVVEIRAPNTMLFAPDVDLGITPVAGTTIDLAELDFVDGRVGEFRLAYLESGEVVRHRGINYDGQYYLDIVERAAEGTVQSNASGGALDYFPAPGPGTFIIELNSGDFTENEGRFFYSGEINVTIPSNLVWAAITCCLAKSVRNEGRNVFIRSNIVEMTQAGPA